MRRRKWLLVLGVVLILGWFFDAATRKPTPSFISQFQHEKVGAGVASVSGGQPVWVEDFNVHTSLWELVEASKSFGGGWNVKRNKAFDGYSLATRDPEEHLLKVALISGRARLKERQDWYGATEGWTHVTLVYRQSPRTRLREFLDDSVLASLGLRQKQGPVVTVGLKASK